MSEELKDQSIYDPEDLAGYGDEEEEDDASEEQENGEEWDGDGEDEEEEDDGSPDQTKEEWTAEDEKKYQELDTGAKTRPNPISRLGKRGLPKTGGRTTGVRNRENALLDPTDERLDKAFDTYDKTYMHKAARYLSPLILRRTWKILKDPKTPPATILAIGKDILPYAYDKPGTSDAKDEGPKKVMIVTQSMHLPDVS